MIVIPAGSLEWQPIALIRSTLADGTDVDLSAGVASCAFLASYEAQPSSGDWVDAIIEAGVQGAPYQISCRIGPGGTVALTHGTWWPWVRLVFDQEIIQRRASGPLSIG